VRATSPVTIAALSWVVFAGAACTHGNPDFAVIDAPGGDARDSAPATEAPGMMPDVLADAAADQSADLNAAPPETGLDCAPALPDGGLPDVSLDLAPLDSGPPDAGRSGVVGRWSMEEGQGNVITDSSGRGNNAMLVGATWMRPGAPSEGTRIACASFDGATYAQAPAVGLPALGARITIAFWMRPSSLSSSRRTALALVRMASPVVGLQFGQDANRAAVWFYGDNSTLITGSQTVTTNTWYHVAYTFEGNTHRLFLGGASIGSSTRAAPAGLPTILRFATYGSSTSQLFVGQLDEVHVYDRALPATEIAALAKL
jgi:hypothetical protein